MSSLFSILFKGQYHEHLKLKTFSHHYAFFSLSSQHALFAFTLLLSLLLSINHACHAQRLKGLAKMDDTLAVIEANADAEVRIELEITQMPAWTEKRIILEHHPVDLPNIPINSIDRLKTPIANDELLWGENPLLKSYLISIQQALLFQIRNQTQAPVRFYAQNIDFDQPMPMILPLQTITLRGRIKEQKPASYGFIYENQSAEFAGIFLKELVSQQPTQGQAFPLKACVVGLNRFHSNRAIRNLESLPWLISCYPKLQAPISTQALPVLDSSDHQQDQSAGGDMGINGMEGDMGMHGEGESREQQEGLLPFKPAPLAPNLIVWPLENIQLINLSPFPLVLKAQNSPELLEIKGDQRIDRQYVALKPNEYMILAQESAVIRHQMSIEQALLSALPFSIQGGNAWYRQRPFLRLISLNRYNTELSQGIWAAQSNIPFQTEAWLKDSWQFQEGKPIQSDITLLYQGSPRTSRFLIAYLGYPQPIQQSPAAQITLTISNLSPQALPFEIESHAFELLYAQGKALNPRVSINQILINPRESIQILVRPRFYPLRMGALSVPEGQKATVELH